MQIISQSPLPIQPVDKIILCKPYYGRGKYYLRTSNSEDYVNQENFSAFSGTASLLFELGEHQRVAVKVIDPRGNEVMRVVRTGE
jgi:hypothetical protein